MNQPVPQRPAWVKRCELVQIASLLTCVLMAVIYVFTPSVQKSFIVLWFVLPPLLICVAATMAVGIWEDAHGISSPNVPYH